MMEEEGSRTIPVEPVNSCKIAINAKGQYSGEVKAYSTSVEGAYADAVAQATVLEELIKIKNKPREAE